MIKRIALIVVLLFAASARAEGQAYAVIVVGPPGSPMYARHFADRTARFSKVFADVGVSGDRLTVVNSDAAAVTNALNKAVAKSQAGDQFILIIIGHGEVADNSCTLILPGPDLQMKAMADLLKPLKCKSQIVLNFARNSGDALAYFAQAGRINIAGSSPTQVNDNDFAEFILQELERKDGSKTLLDVYNRATLNFARWTVRQKTPPEEGKLGWIVEGRESAEVFKKLYGDADVPDNRKFLPSPEAEKADAADPKLLPDGSPAWANRRMISESPVLDDGALAAPASTLSDKGYVAITPSAQNGAIAAKTTLGMIAVKPSTAPTTQP